MSEKPDKMFKVPGSTIANFARLLAGIEISAGIITAFVIGTSYDGSAGIAWGVFFGALILWTMLYLLAAIAENSKHIAECAISIEQTLSKREREEQITSELSELSHLQKNIAGKDNLT